MRATTLEIVDEQGDISLSFFELQHGFNGVSGNIGKDNTSNLSYRRNDREIGNLYKQFGEKGGLDVLWLGALLFDEIQSGRGTEAAPLIIEELVSRVDRMLIHRDFDIADHTLGKRVESLLDSKVVTVGSEKSPIAWQKFISN